MKYVSNRSVSPECLFLGCVSIQSVTDAKSEKTVVAIREAAEKLQVSCKAERNLHEYRTEIMAKI